MTDVYLRPVAANQPTRSRCPCHDKPASECPRSHLCINARDGREKPEHCNGVTFPFETNVPGYCSGCVSEPGWFELTDEPQHDPG